MLDYLINNNRINIHFQPIISMKDDRIFAFEALTRAYNEDKELISPLFLFEQARKENRSTELDDYVRKLAIEKFKSYYEQDNSTLLFLNFESSMIDEKARCNFLDNLKNNNIPNENIVIEIKEDNIKDNYYLEQFVEKYKNLGFIIAIDDFGTGYSSFDRLALIKPDIVKIDRSLVYNIQENFINSEILNAISKMCHKIGAVLLAEGVENEQEILTCMEKDIDIYQGFYYSRAQKEIEKTVVEDVDKKIKLIHNRYRDNVQKHYGKELKMLNRAKRITKKTIEIINNKDENYREQILEFIKKDKYTEAIYLLEYQTGIQIGDTIIDSANKRILYSPTNNGHDHSFKEYFLNTKNSKNKKHITDKYISKASGSMCSTYCQKITLGSFDYILCCDIVEDKTNV